MEKVKFNIKVYDNYLELIPIEPLKDNSLYTISIQNIESENGDRFSGKFNISTKLTPLYSDVYAVQSIVDEIDIPEDVILYNIREASRFVDYMKSGMKVDEDNPPFEVSQFVKYKAAHECILRHCVNISSTSGVKGAVGNVSFEDKDTTRDIAKLLNTLGREVDKWKDEVRGYKLEGRAKMQSTTLGKNATPAIGTIGLTIERGI